MKKTTIVLALVFLCSAMSVFAATKTYQVTGPVLALTADMITVQKGSEKWEIERAGSKVTGDLKVGSKVTVEYRMTATKIEAKAEAAPAKKK